LQAARKRAVFQARNVDYVIDFVGRSAEI